MKSEIRSKALCDHFGTHVQMFNLVNVFPKEFCRMISKINLSLKKKEKKKK